jgi:superfamily II DNA or RNA helicase
MTKLLKYQEEHVHRILNAFKTNNVVLDCSDTGTGKTYVACYIAKALGLHPIIICPKSVVLSWSRVCKLFELEPYGISNYESIKNSTWWDSSHKKTICPYIKYTKVGEDHGYTWSPPDDCIFIFDEAHRAKNYNTVNANILLALKEHREKVKIMLLSATLSDKPEYFAVFATMLGLTNNVMGYRLYQRRIASIDPEKPLMFILNSVLFPKMGSRMRISELGDLFPKHQIIPEVYEMGSDVEDQISGLYGIISNLKAGKPAVDSRTLLKFDEDLKMVVKDLNTSIESSTTHLTWLIKVRQKIEALKTDTIIDLALDHLDDGMSVVIFVNFRDTVALLNKRLDCKCFVQGDQTMQERDRMIELFQSNKEKLIICQMQSGGVGISLHDIHGGHPRVSLISPSWSAQDLVQALGRIYRAETKTPCLQKIIYCANTPELRICEVIKEKIDNYSQFNDGVMEHEIKL